MPDPAEIVVVEDDARTRAQLCAAIRNEPDLHLVAEFGHARPALAWIEAHPVHVLLTDLGLPDGSGIDLIRACARLHPCAEIMVITMFGDEDSVLSSIAAGAAGYLLKDGEHLHIAQALRDLRQGGSPMSPLIARKVLTRMRTTEPRQGGEMTVMSPSTSGTKDPAIQLTRRESATLDLIARGYTYEETARLMSVSISTVQTHIRAIYSKLAVKSRSQAVFEAHKLGLLQDGLLKP